MTTSSAAPHRTIAITGASGLIGRALEEQLGRDGHSVRRFVRGATGLRAGDIRWDPMQGTIDERALAGVDAIVHLAGEPVAHRWTHERKRAIRESRVLGTQLLARAVAAMERRPSVVLSGSAIGYYGDRGDAPLTETSAAGNDFLASVAQEWEGASAAMGQAGVRVAHLRTGLVLSPRGGALEKLLIPFRLGAGGQLGSGRQWMSWISLTDHVRATLHALHTESLEGPINLTAPVPVTNAEFTSTLGSVLGRPTVMTVPSMALELLYGEMARATLLAGQRVLPHALEQSGFVFEHRELREALEAELK